MSVFIYYVFQYARMIALIIALVTFSQKKVLLIYEFQLWKTHQLLFVISDKPSVHSIKAWAEEVGR